MRLEDLTTELRILLNLLKVDFREVNLSRGFGTIFIISNFGSILVPMYRKDYVQILAKLEELYPTYRYMFVSQDSNLIKVKDKIIWELMRSGYMRYIRLNFPLQFKQLLNEHNYARKIIKERLRIWSNLKKYIFLVEENKWALSQSSSRILALEPDFFDYMPEEV